MLSHNNRCGGQRVCRRNISWCQMGAAEKIAVTPFFFFFTLTKDTLHWFHLHHYGSHPVRHIGLLWLGQRSLQLLVSATVSFPLPVWKSLLPHPWNSFRFLIITCCVIVRHVCVTEPHKHTHTHLVTGKGYTISPSQSPTLKPPEQQGAGMEMLADFVPSQPLKSWLEPQTSPSSSFMRCYITGLRAHWAYTVFCESSEQDEAGVTDWRESEILLIHVEKFRAWAFSNLFFSLSVEAPIARRHRT